MVFGTPLGWRETHKPARFLIFEGRVVFVLLLAVMHLRFWTVILAFATMFVLWWFDRKGVSADSILRYLRARLVGRKRSARGVHNERLAVDFWHEPEVYRRHKAAEAARNAAGSASGGGMLAGVLRMIGLAPKPAPDPEPEPSAPDTPEFLSKEKTE